MKQFNEIAKKVYEINLEPILFTLTKREDWTQWSIQKAKEVEALYRNFLILVGTYPGKNIVPTKDIDTFWHTHILDTEKYMIDCQNAFGYYIHHFPYFGLRGEKDERFAKKSFDETIQLFKKHFDFDLNSSQERCSSYCRSACGPKNNLVSCAKTSNTIRPVL